VFGAYAAAEYSRYVGILLGVVVPSRVRKSGIYAHKYAVDCSWSLAVQCGNLKTSSTHRGLLHSWIGTADAKFCTHERQLEEREQIVGVGHALAAASGPLLQRRYVQTIKLRSHNIGRKRGEQMQKTKRVAVTPDSRVVPHPSTKEARRSLTSEFG